MKEESFVLRVLLSDRGVQEEMKAEEEEDYCLLSRGNESRRRKEKEGYKGSRCGFVVLTFGSEDLDPVGGDMFYCSGSASSR